MISKDDLASLVELYGAGFTLSRAETTKEGFFVIEVSHPFSDGTGYVWTDPDTITSEFVIMWLQKNEEIERIRSAPPIVNGQLCLALYLWSTATHVIDERFRGLLRSLEGLGLLTTDEVDWVWESAQRRGLSKSTNGC